MVGFVAQMVEHCTGIGRAYERKSTRKSTIAIGNANEMPSITEEILIAFYVLYSASAQTQYADYEKIHGPFH